MPPTAAAVVSRPNPTEPSPSWLGRRRGPAPTRRRPKVTLKVKIATARVRTAAWSDSQRMPSAMSRRMCGVADVADRAPRGGPTGDQDDAERHADRLGHERQRHPAGEKERPERRAASWLRAIEARHQAGVADPEVVAVRRASAAGSRLALSAKTSAKPTGTSRPAPPRCRPAGDHRHRRGGPGRPTRRPSQTITMRRRSSGRRAPGVQAEEQPRAGAAAERPGRPGRVVASGEATSSGPAASDKPVAERGDPATRRAASGSRCRDVAGPRCRRRVRSCSRDRETTRDGAGAVAAEGGG